MKIAIAYNFNDLDWLGGKNYFTSLLNAIKKISPSKFEIIIIMGKKTISSLPDEFPLISIIRTSLMDRLHPFWLIRQLTLRTLGTDPLLEYFLQQKNIKLISHSTQFGKGSYVRSVPWLYDFQFMYLPKYWTKRQLQWIKKRYNDSCRLGNGLIVSSQQAAKDLKIFSPDCNKPVYVLPFVSNPIDFVNLPSVHEICRQYDLPSLFFYLPNQFWSNKNHRIVIDALEILCRKGIHTTVVCTGKTFDGRKPQYFNELMTHCYKSGLTDRFRVLGVVPKHIVQGLMIHSVAVINPSRFEGWSTTVEEAKTLRKRLLLSDIPVHREQAPANASFFGVDDPCLLSDLMKKSLNAKPIPLDRNIIVKDYEDRLEAFGQQYLDIIRDQLSAL